VADPLSRPGSTRNWLFCALHHRNPARLPHARNRRSARFGIHVGRIVAYVRLRPRMQRRYSVQRLGRHTWAAGLGPGLGSVLVSFIPVRRRSPVATRIVSLAGNCVACMRTFGWLQGEPARSAKLPASPEALKSWLASLVDAAVIRYGLVRWAGFGPNALVLGSAGGARRSQFGRCPYGRYVTWAYRGSGHPLRLCVSLGLAGSGRTSGRPSPVRCRRCGPGR
jgi:hypothetical protein